MSDDAIDQLVKKYAAARARLAEQRTLMAKLEADRATGEPALAKLDEKVENIAKADGSGLEAACAELAKAAQFMEQNTVGREHCEKAIRGAEQDVESTMQALVRYPGLASYRYDR